MENKTEIFKGWQGQPIVEILWLCQEIVEDSSIPTVNDWHQNGGKILGHFQVYFPEEIAHAAGMLPYKMCGATLESRHADSRFGSYLCSIIKTSLELVLSDRIKLDMFVTHPICDAARNLGTIWGRNYSHPCQILYLPQNPNSSYSIQYLTDEYNRLKGVIEEVAEHKITESELNNSIQVFNHNRLLIRKLYEIKKTKPWLITVSEAYSLVKLSGMIPREEHNTLMETVLPMIESRNIHKQDKMRVVFEGGFCEQPPLDMLRSIGRSCYVVDDDLLIGLRWILNEVNPGNDSIKALAAAYINQSSYSPVQHDLRKPKEKMLVDRIKGSNAEAAIITAAKMCEPGLEEQVTYTQTLDEMNFPYFISEFEENMTSFDHLEIQLETFVENLLFD